MGHEVVQPVAPDAVAGTTAEASGVTPVRRGSHHRNRPLLPPLPHVPGWPTMQELTDLAFADGTLAKELEAYEHSPGRETLHPAGGSLNHKSFG